MSEVTETIKEYLEDELLDGDAELRADTPLLKTELIDSMGVLTLVGFIEDEFGITVGADDVSTDNFHSLETITKYVESKLA